MTASRQSRPGASAAPGRVRRTRSELPTTARLAVVFLTGVSVFALLAATLMMTTAPAAGDPADLQTALVRGFYGAANDILAGGDADALSAFVAPDLTVHGAGDAPIGKVGLIHRLSRLRAASPSLRFTIDALTIAGERATAAVALEGDADPIFGVPVQGWQPVRRRVETFRFAGGRIAEYWPDQTDQADARALPPLPIALEEGAARVGLARFTYPLGAELALGVAPGPEALIGEIGAVSVTLSKPGSWFSADAPERGWRPAAGTIVVRPGDALLVPPDAEREIRNQGAVPATTLGLIFYHEPRRIYHGWEPPPNGPAFRILYDPARVGRPAIWGSGVLVDVLASGTMSGGEPAPATLALGWLALGPGQTIPPHQVAGVELLAVESGVALVAGAQPAAPAAASKPGAQDQRLLMGGDAAAFSTGISAPIDHLGADTTRALLVVVVPAA